jgi:undecaprenyl-diphosphatase
MAGTALALSTLGLVVVVRRVARRETTDADQQWGARLGTGQVWADRLSYLALPRNVFIETIALALLGRLDQRERVEIVAAPLLAAVAGHALKLSVPRDRPGPARFSPQGNESFPSTHAALATALALAAAEVGRQRGLGLWIRGAAVAIAGAIGLARLRASAHWPSDVIAGWLLGTASAQLTRLATAAER